MNYEVIDELEMYSVLETTTNQVIKTFKNFSEAKKMATDLNLGYAFDGFTPNFFLKKVLKN